MINFLFIRLVVELGRLITLVVSAAVVSLSRASSSRLFPRPDSLEELN